MSWARYDDELHFNRKVTYLRSHGDKGMAALGLHLVANTWARNQGTKGVIPDYMLTQLAGKGGAALARLLATVPPGCTTGMFERGDGCWLIHDYDQYHDPADPAPDRSASERRSDLSAKRAAAGRQGGLAKAGKRPSNPASKPLANTQQDAAPVPEPEPEPEPPTTPVGERVQEAATRQAGETPSSDPTTAARHAAIAAAYARIIADNTPNVRHRPAFLDTQIRHILDRPAIDGNGTELERLAALFPTAPTDAIAAWLTGDKHSMAHYPRADELDPPAPTEPEEPQPPRLRLLRAPQEES